MSFSNNSHESNEQFLTYEYVENILKKYLQESSLKVIDMKSNTDTSKGEGYCSIITRVKVNYKVDQDKHVKQINILVKAPFDDQPHLVKILQNLDVFNTEMQMYETVLPQLQQMLYAIGDSEQLCAKTIHVDYDRNVIILENLSVRNFVMANRLKGMDEIHIKFCLRKLAKLHATTAVLNERQKGCLEKYCHGILNRHVNCYGVFYENMFRECAKFAETCSELGVYYKQKLLKLLPYVAEYGTRCCDPNAKHFLALNHGDLWTNNFMVQYNEGEEDGIRHVKDVLLIDFQYCNWSSPAVDVHYLLNTSLQDDLTFNHQPKLIQYYHSVLSETLKKLKYKQHIPTLHEFNVQLLERAFYALATTVTNFPLMVNDKTEDADYECIVASDARARRFHSILYTSERVQRILKIMLPRFDQMGLLDIQEN